VDERHASSVAPGKRPRLTPAPALVLRDGRPVLAFGTPGGDVQIQAMAQVLVNLVDFRMDPQEAVEAPRFATYNFPGSFSPHAYNPGLLRMERRLGDDALAELARLGNRVEPWEDFAWRSGGVCAVLYDAERGIVQGAADPRRECYAFGY
jgi:gamma-glutamyltranspeptidase/glutathione hydrolase